MSQVFTPEGVVPVTEIEAGPVVITALKTKERDGYQAAQVGFEPVSDKRRFRVRREWRAVTDSLPELSLGQELTVDGFAVGDIVAVSGVSKGKGFQGVVKRHGFRGGPRTHGQKHSEREPGSIGGGLRTRVPKGMRMAGRMGGKRVTIRNLRVVAVDAADRRLLVSGAIPGRRGTVLEIRS